ncbi:MAG: DegV family protein [Firmicutes bacterium]|nr:DegV family protein [Bacillota bacterium]
MNKVVILTDSTADLSLELRTELDVFSIPHYVKFENEIYRDGLDLAGDDLYAVVREKKTIPKTAPATHEDFIGFFDQYLDHGYDIVYIGIGSKFSMSYQNVMLAKDEMDSNRVYIIDSQNISSGIGILVLKAVKMRNQRFSAKRIHQEIVKLVPQVRSLFAVRRVEYLLKGGRIGIPTSLMGAFFGLKLIIRVNDGRLIIHKRPFGKIKKAIRIMLKTIYEDQYRLDTDYVMVTHSLANRQALYMIAQLNKHLPNVEIIESRAGCVISTHCGSGAIGITYLINNNMKETRKLT